MFCNDSKNPIVAPAGRIAVAPVLPRHRKTQALTIFRLLTGLGEKDFSPALAGISAARGSILKTNSSASCRLPRHASSHALPFFFAQRLMG
jgi:hypothetical protein